MTGLDAATVVPLLFVGQAAFSAALLATQRDANRPANACLAAFFAILAGNMALTAAYASGAIDVNPHLARVTTPLEFLYGPLLYLYARTSVGYRLTRRAAWHLLPGLIALAWLAPFFALDAEQKRTAISRLLAGRDADDWVRWAARWGVLTVYALATLRLLRRHARRVREQLSDTAPVELDWLRRTGIAVLLAQGVELVFTIHDTLAHAPVVNSALNSALLLVIASVTATWALRQPPLRFAGDPDAPAAVPPVLERPPDPPLAPRYERSGLGPEAARALADHLDALMSTAEPWRSDDLTLGELARQAGASPHDVSRAINEQFARNFFDYVNGWRVREVQRLLRDPAQARRSILELAFAAGFSSKSSFNAAFKKATGMTPRAFRDGAPR